MNSKYDELAFEDLEKVVGGDQNEAFRYRAKLYEKYRIPPNNYNSTKMLAKVATQEERDYFQYLCRHKTGEPLNPAPL